MKVLQEKIMLRDHHVEKIFVSADKIQNHKQAHENIIVSYYVLQILASYFENC